MRNIFLLVAMIIVGVASNGQGNSGKKNKEKETKTAEVKNKEKVKESKDDKEKIKKEKAEKAKHDNTIWEGTIDKNGDGPKPSKNQPAKVRQAFQQDYPNASNVYWTKYRGDWTATFNNGPWRSTAVYHANGQRKDTRTPVVRESIPRRIQDVILKRNPENKLDEAVKIEVPKTVKDIFRIKDIINGKAEFSYYDADGNKVEYDY